MPELPEVETVVRQLAPLVAGRTIGKLELLDDKLDPDRPGRIKGKTIKGIHRRGKTLVIELGKGAGKDAGLLLAVHLRMTGRLIWSPDGLPENTRHLRAVLHLDEGSLQFFDPRRFGKLVICKPEDLPAAGGAEPLSGEFTAARLGGLLGKSRQPIKPWLLRQDKVAGIGNIYASETLHAARLSPFREAGSLDRGEIRRLHGAIRRVLKKAIALGGTTFSDFQDARGRAGGFRRMLAVYGRAGEPCRACGAAITKVRQQGRSTYCCENCQH